MEILFVGVGGFFGCCSRYMINTLSKNLNTGFPYGTLISNVVAGVLIGFIMGIEMQTSLISPRLKLFLTTGFLGGLSTFSAFSLETVTLFSSGKYLMSIGNIFFNLSLSILGVVCGMAVARLLFRKA